MVKLTSLALFLRPGSLSHFVILKQNQNHKTKISRERSNFQISQIDSNDFSLKSISLDQSFLLQTA